jgi:enoyl-CoA hydratase/carnithine racemase
MNYEQIRYDVNHHILLLTLDRPEKLNAFTPQMREELIDAFDRADGDDDVRAVVVTGAGRAFCAGADLSTGRASFDYAAKEVRSDPAAHRDGGGRLTLRIFESIKPVIAAINGPAVGIGATMTLAMDVRLAVTDARIGFVFTRRGIVPEACSSWFLPRIVGISRALEWIFSGRMLSADEAYRGGLLRSLHAGGDLLDAARALASEISENTSAVSVALARQMLWRMLGADHPMEAHRVESRAMFATGRSEDAREGVSAFLEKRKPRFPGKPGADMPSFYPWWEKREF